jgi:UDP-N-acetylglucosamine 2-epimerase (non-hydrolysing)
LREHVAEEQIIVTGNTVIDALQMVVGKLREDTALASEVVNRISEMGYDVTRLNGSKRMVLITGHRRENFGEGFLNICHAIKHLAEQYPEVDFVYPMHLNPNVRKPVLEILGEGAENVFLIEPLDYLPFVYMMQHSTLILTDSGGVQEEAPSLGKPVLVLRDTTERPEGVQAGTLKVCGTDEENIYQSIMELLHSENLYRKMSEAKNPYGDGFASKYIADAIVKYFSQNK